MGKILREPSELTGEWVWERQEKRMGSLCEITAEVKGTEQFLVIRHEPEEDINQYLLKMLEYNSIRGILPLKNQYLDGKTVLNFQVGDRYRLTELARQNKLGVREARLVFVRLVDAFLEMKEYFLNADQCVCDLEYLYVDATLNPYLPYLPFESVRNQDINRVWRDFFQSVLSLFSGGERNDFYDRLMRYLIQPCFHLREFRACLTEGEESMTAHVIPAAEQLGGAGGGSGFGGGTASGGGTGFGGGAVSGGGAGFGGGAGSGGSGGFGGGAGSGGRGGFGGGTASGGGTGFGGGAGAGGGSGFGGGAASGGGSGFGSGTASGGGSGFGGVNVPGNGAGAGNAGGVSTPGKTGAAENEKGIPGKGKGVGIAVPGSGKKEPAAKKESGLTGGLFRKKDSEKEGAGTAVPQAAPGVRIPGMETGPAAVPPSKPAPAPVEESAAAQETGKKRSGLFGFGKKEKPAKEETAAVVQEISSPAPGQRGGSGQGEWSKTVFVMPDPGEQPKTVMLQRQPYLTNRDNYIPMSQFPFTVGKGSASYIVANPTVSRHHITILRQGNAYYVRDENSTNKTQLNGRELEPFKPELLQDGDRLQISNEELIFHTT